MGSVVMAPRNKSSEVLSGDGAAEQFVFVDVPAPSNDNSGALAGKEDSIVSPDVMFVIGEYIFDFDDSDASTALMLALDGADADAAEYAAFSSSVMFVFGDAAVDG